MGVSYSDGMSPEELASFEAGMREWDRDRGKDGGPTDEDLDDMEREFNAGGGFSRFDAMAADSQFSGLFVTSVIQAKAGRNERLTARDREALNDLVVSEAEDIYQAYDRAKQSHDYNMTVVDGGQEFLDYSEAEFAAVEDLFRERRDALFKDVYDSRSMDVPYAVWPDKSSKIITEHTVELLGDDYKAYEAQRFDEYLADMGRRHGVGIGLGSVDFSRDVVAQKQVQDTVQQSREDVAGRKVHAPARDAGASKGPVSDTRGVSSRGHEFDDLLAKEARAQRGYALGEN